MKKLIAICTVALMGGCSLFSPYVKMSNGYGYTDIRLAPDVIRVTFVADDRVGRGDHIDELVLMRSAEATLANGYRYFVVTSEERETTVSSYDEPAVSTTTEVVTRKKGGAREATSSTATTVAKTTETKRPRVMQLIRCYAEAPKDAGGRVVHDAQEIWSRLAPKYDVKRAPER